MQVSSNRNHGMLQRLLRLAPEANDRHGYGLVDWARACGLLCVTTPDLVRVTYDCAAFKAERHKWSLALSWLVTTVEDLARVLGQMWLPPHTAAHTRGRTRGGTPDVRAPLSHTHCESSLTPSHQPRLTGVSVQVAQKARYNHRKWSAEQDRAAGTKAGPRRGPQHAKEEMVRQGQLLGAVVAHRLVLIFAAHGLECQPAGNCPENTTGSNISMSDPSLTRVREVCCPHSPRLNIRPYFMPWESVRLGSSVELYSNL